MLAIIYFY